MDLQIFWFCLIGFLWAGYFVLEGFDFGVGMLLPFLPRGRARAGRDVRVHRSGLGRQRGLAGCRRRGDVRRVPGLVRDAVLGLLPRAAAHPLLPDRPRRLVRVAREERQPTLASLCGRVRTRSAASACRSSGASRSRIFCEACRSTRTATTPGTSGICSASTPCSPVWRSSLFFAFHGAGYLTLRTTGDLRERAAATALQARGARGGVRRRVPDLDGEGRRRQERPGRASRRRFRPARRSPRVVLAIVLSVLGPQRMGVRAHGARRSCSRSGRSSRASTRA